MRHGETAHNAEGRIQGQTDTPVSPTGRAQAVATGRHLRHCFAARPVLLPVPQYVFTSDLSRARETAEIIARIADLPAPVLSPALRERHYGEWQGLLAAEIALRRQTLEHPPGGETEQNVHERMGIALDWLWKNTGQGDAVALVVGHGGSLRSLFCRALGLPADLMGRFRLENCALSVVEFAGDEGINAGRIVRANDAGHLRGTDLSAQTLAV